MPSYDLPLLSHNYQETSDLDFELKVHEHLRSVGCESEHGGRYLDHITQKMREFDILAKPPKNFFNGGTEVASFHKTKLVIECKNVTEDFPIVVGVRPYEYEQVRFMRLMRDRKIEVTGYQGAIDIARMHTCVSNFGQEFIEYLGVEVAQIPATLKAGKPDKTSLYDKWSQSVSHAAVQYGEMVAEVAKGSSNGDFQIWCPSVLVVPDDRLFIAIRSKTGISIRPVPGTSVKVGYEFEVPMLTGQRVCISNYFVFTYTGFQRFISMFR